jgi:hypothetical protein
VDFAFEMNVAFTTSPSATALASDTGALLSDRKVRKLRELTTTVLKNGLYESYV